MKRLINHALIMLLSLIVCGLSLADDRWPAYVLELPEAISGVFVADTSSATIYRFERTSSGMEAVHRGYMSIGENGAGKQRAWDRKTPLGIYFIVDQLDTSRLHKKYGAMAFPVDYPNTWDRRHERNGDGIWVHGVLANGEQRPPRDTDGCLALPNEDLLALENVFQPNMTPVIIAPEIVWRDAAARDALRNELKSSIQEWVAALSSRDVRAYLAMYSKSFRYRGLSFDDWAVFRTQSMRRFESLTVDIDDLTLLEDPVEEGLFLSRFRHTVISDSVTTATMKRLYWQRDTSGKLRIVAEDNG